MKKYGRMYFDVDYGVWFNVWLNSDNCEFYNSFGNGLVMCVFLCVWIMDCGFCVRIGMWLLFREFVSFFVEVIYNYLEGIKGVMVIVDVIFLCCYYFGGYCGDYE